jgi:hypothetical protein
MQELPHLLALIGLIVGTLDYALLVRSRERGRRALHTAAVTGLRGLVRVMAADYVTDGGYARKECAGAARGRWWATLDSNQ